MPAGRFWRGGREVGCVAHAPYGKQAPPGLGVAQQGDLGVTLVGDDQVVDAVHGIARAFEALQRVRGRHAEIAGDAERVVPAQARSQDLLGVIFSERSNQAAGVDESD